MFPYITTHNDFEIDGITFWSLRGSWQQFLGDSQVWDSIRGMLNVFRDQRNEHVSDGIGILLGSKDIPKVTACLLALRYECLSQEFPWSSFHDEHFSYVTQAPKPSRGDQITLIEGHHTTFGSPKWMTRRLPGPLSPQVLAIQGQRRDDVEHLARLVRRKERENIRRAVEWYCRSRRWSADKYDRLIAIMTALEVLVGIKETNRKADQLAIGLVGLTVDQPLVSSWVGTAYKLRNALLHEGYADDERFIYRDPVGNIRVRYHEEIGSLLFREAVAGIAKSARSSTHEVVATIIRLMKTDRIVGAISSNRRKLDEILELLKHGLGVDEDAAKVLSLTSQVSDQDFSLSAKDCSRYLDAVNRACDVLVIREESYYRETILRSLRGLLRALERFKQTLEFGEFVLPQ